MAAGLVAPLRLAAAGIPRMHELEHSTLADLQSWQGNRSLSRFIEQTISCDDDNPLSIPLSARINGWARFQTASVATAEGHHRARIATKDGVEDDEFGAWARAAGIVLRGALRRICPPGQEAYVAAAPARGLKYRARAESADLLYQSHPLRRDFLITFDLAREGVGDTIVLDVIRAVRGIHDSLITAADDSQASRVELVELELPLLGGRLWATDETGRHTDSAWLGLITDRIAAYRDNAAPIRQAIERCGTHEDFLRVVRDIAGAGRDLLSRLGIRSTELSALERDLVGGVASVVESVPGLPKVGGLWLSARRAGRHLHSSGSPLQKFLYREFAHAWKRAGH